VISSKALLAVVSAGKNACPYDVSDAWARAAAGDSTDNLA
jgi:hypothetical protein